MIKVKLVGNRLITTIDNLYPWKDNPRDITKDGFERLKRQIQSLGQYKPLLVTEDGEIIGGNMRYRAYIELGIKNVWVSIVKPKDNKEKLAYSLSDNDRAGYYVKDELANIVSSYEDFEWRDYAVDIKEPITLDNLIEPEIEEDEVPEVKEEAEPESKYGEVHQLGRHRLMCGDATKKEDVEKLMDGKKADMVFTDPPYNVDYGASKNPRHKYRIIKNDKLDAEGWEAFNRDWIANMALVSKKQADIYVWGAPGPEGMRQRLWLNELGYHWSATIIWKKQQLVLTPANYQRKYEPCFYGWLSKSSWQGSRKETEVWEIDRPLNSKLHPTMKPIALCSKGIKNSSKIDDIVLDLFGGSGSTLIACEQTNRICYMMELDPHYCDVIRKRYENYTKKKSRSN